MKKTKSLPMAIALEACYESNMESEEKYFNEVRISRAEWMRRHPLVKAAAVAHLYGDPRAAQPYTLRLLNWIRKLVGLSNG